MGMAGAGGCFTRWPGAGMPPTLAHALSRARLFLPEPASALGRCSPGPVPGLFCLLRCQPGPVRPHEPPIWCGCWRRTRPRGRLWITLSLCFAEKMGNMDKSPSA